MPVCSEQETISVVRPFLLSILISLLAGSAVFAQQYYPTIDQYGAGQYGSLPQITSPAASLAAPNAAVPSQYAAPSTYGVPSYPATYPATYPSPYPVAGTIPNSVPYPVTNGTPYSASSTSPYPTPYPAPYATPYSTPGPVTGEVPYSASAAVPYSAPYAAPAAEPLTYQVPVVPALVPTAPPEADVVAPASEPATPAEETEPAAAPKEEPGDEALPEGEDEALVVEEVPTEWYDYPVFWLDQWEGNVEIGLSGSEGNSPTLNYLIGLDAKRETERHVLDFDLKYNRKTADSVETAHNLDSEIRWELLLEDSPWTWFIHETTEYDEFKDFDIRLSYDTGLGRELVKNDTTSLLARIGGGVSHEVGSSDEDMVPEAVFSLELSHKLNERQKLSASSEYSPDVTDFVDYRMKSKASWEVVLDEETNLSLKVSVTDTYDSTTDGDVKPNDFDYTLTLLWNF